MRGISKSEAAGFLKRWRVVEQFQKQELLLETLEQKFSKLCRLAASLKLFQPARFRRQEAREILAVRDRWRRLRRAVAHG